MNKMCTASSSKKGAKKSESKKGGKAKHHVKHMTIRRVDNGFIADHGYGAANNTPEDEATAPMPDSKVFQNSDELGQHVMDQFGDNPTPPAGAAQQPPAEGDNDGDEG